MKARLTVDNLSFESAHNLYDYDGKCANLHGHSYKMSVTVEGVVGQQGFVIDFNDLKKVVKESIIDVYDHKYLNDMFDFNPTAENMVIYFAQVLMESLSKFGGLKLKSVKLWETANNCAEVLL